RRDQLTPLFYRGDRAMRASGFDTSNRFGAFGSDTISYNPVCLNSLLYKMELDLAHMSTLLGRAEDAARFTTLARERAARINRLMWNQDRGLYFDYHVPSGQQSRYAFATTFFPLWAGLATREQADRVARNLPL